MAERRSNTNRNRNSNGALSASDAIKQVRRELPQLLGRPIEAVLGVQRNEEDGWKVIVQVVELSRIPSTTDVLGAYAVTLDQSGELIGYSRSRRYHRNQADED